MNKKESDLTWVIELHKQAKAMGMPDEKIKDIARTESGLHPEDEPELTPEEEAENYGDYHYQKRKPTYGGCVDSWRDATIWKDDNPNEPKY